MGLLRRSIDVASTTDLPAEFAADWDRLEIHGQGIHSTTDGSLLATEALLRWRRNANELWAAGMILPIAEDTNTIEACTDWATELAIGVWPTSETRSQGGRLALNLHGTQLARPTIASSIATLLDGHGIAPEELLLEIPDRIGPDACRRAVDHLGPLVDDGARLALDDHRGTGSTTRPTPDWLPAGSLVKLDTALVMACDEPVGREILELTADTLHAGGYDLVAESIERPGQLAAVVRARIAYAQGFLFDKPAPIA